MTSDEILEVKEVAKMFKVHPRTITNMVERGELKAFRVGNLLRFRKSDIENFINSQLEGKKSSEEDKQEEDKEPLPCQRGWKGKVGT